jgi:ABC-type sugar transport system permease subunit/ABC-type glycerol-3-phosphate transport system substrate-binding protein
MKRYGLVLLFIGLMLVLARWGDVVTRLTGGERTRVKRVMEWSWSGTPDVERRRAEKFEQIYPDTRVELQFLQVSRMWDTIYVSFISGNPPDLMGVSMRDARDYVAAGMLRPMDDMLERELARHPDFVDNRINDRQTLMYYQTNPNDPLIKDMAKHPLEAARLLHMHGKFMGFINPIGINALTYNKRLFRNAARMFPEAGLVDSQGEPVPPRTWMELLRVADVLTKYGKESKEGCYGLVMREQFPRETMSAISVLASTAGSVGFDYRGDKWIDGVDQPVGKFTPEHPAFLGAFRLLLKMKAQGSVLPGGSSREYEEVRTAVGSGRAAMVLDGWHAALIASERVPWAKNDIGSAPIPVPYDETSPNAAAQKAEIEALLQLPVQRSRPPRGDISNTTCITSGAANPDAVWNWMHWEAYDQERMKAGTRRGSLPPNKMAASKINDPDWYPLPYQKQVWTSWAGHALWPASPQFKKPLGKSEQDIFHELMGQITDAKDKDQIIPDLMTKAKTQLDDYAQRVNGSLAERVKSGMELPTAWTFADFDPMNPQLAFERQQELARDPAVKARIDALIAQLPPEYRNPADAQELFRFKPSNGRGGMLAVLGLLVLVAGGYLGFSYIAGNRRDAALPWLMRKSQMRRYWYGYVFIMPGMLLLFVFVVYPTLYQFYLAMHEGSGLTPLRYIGFSNFNRIMQDRPFWTKVLPNTMLYMVVVTTIQIAIALFVANLLSLPLKLNRYVRALFFIPMATALSAIAIVFFGLLGGGESSTVNQVIAYLHLDWLPGMFGLTTSHEWLGSPKTDLYSVMLVGIWHGLPYNTILLLAGLQSIDPQLYEAADVDGATAWQRFWHITIPELMPVLVIIVFNALVGAARVFGVVYILTGGGKGYSSEVVSTYIFKYGFTKPEFGEPDLGYASALGIAYSLILAALTITNVTIMARRWRAQVRNEEKGMTVKPATVVAGKEVAHAQ